jgi:hypothetical protein
LGYALRSGGACPPPSCPASCQTTLRHGFPIIKLSNNHATFVLATRFARGLSRLLPLKTRGSRECRAFGSPAASCAKVKSTRVSRHRFAETIRHSLRDGFTTYSALSPAIGRFCHRHRRNAKHWRRLHASVEALRPRGFVVRETSAFVLCAVPRPSHPAPNVRDDRDTPLMESARRANQCI